MKNQWTHRVAGAVILAVALATTAAACSSDATSSGSDGSGATTAAGEPAAAELPDGVNEADVEFVQGMIPHHEQAIEMSAMVIANGEDPSVIALAEQINAAQGPEIDQMNAWLDDWGIAADGSGDMDGMSGMNGMMSTDEMDTMSGLTGTDLDRTFLEMMIRHHEGAIQMAQVELDNGSNAEVLALAQAIIDGQQAEIDQMQSMVEDT